MRQTLYSVLNRDAKSWWYHRQLRDQGKTVEARELERASIRSTIKSLRFCLKNNGLLTVGRGGFSLHCGITEKSKNSTSKLTVSGYDSERYIELARLVGIPVVDSRGVDVVDLIKTNFPMVNLEIETSEESSGGYKTVKDFIAIYSKLNGVKVYEVSK